LATAEIGPFYELFNEAVIVYGNRLATARCGHPRRAKPLPPRAFGAIMNAR